MSFQVLSVFANAGLATADETYVVVEIDPHGVGREVYITRQSALPSGHNAQTLRAAFTLAWEDVRAVRQGGNADPHWQLEVKRHPEFDGGQSGWEAGDRVYPAAGVAAPQALAAALEARRMRHAGYLLALHPRYLQKYPVKDALNEAAADHRGAHGVTTSYTAACARAGRGRASSGLDGCVPAPMMRV